MASAYPYEMDTSNTQSRDEILKFWFGLVSDDSGYIKERNQFWFTRDAKKDNFIKNQFGALLEAASQNQLDHWKSTAEGSLALIILLDQFSRNIHRDSPKAFANDEMCLAIAKDCVERSFDKKLHAMMRPFIYLPYEHSESMADQIESMKLFDQLIAETTGTLKEAMENYREYAKRHHDIIQRFGRYPHRNKVLGRESTGEEIEFLKEPGSSFG